MKLSALLFLISALPVTVFSQFTLDETHFPAAGETETYTVQVTGLDVENAGPDQTWNMAFISGGQNIDLEYGIPEDLDDEDQFPSANLVEITGQTLTYLDQTDDEMYIVGINVADQAIYTYTDPLKYYEFNFDYLDTYSDDFFAEIAVEGFDENGSTSGTYEVTYDAYGTLELPYGTLENTARRMAVNTLNESFDGNSVDAVSTVYTWYVEDYEGFVAAYIVIEIPGQETQRVVNILTESDFNTIQELQASKVSIYPNPSSDYIQVQTDAHLVSYELINLQGQTVKKDILGFDKTLSVSELPSGTYILQLLTAKGRITKKIIVE